MTQCDPPLINPGYAHGWSVVQQCVVVNKMAAGGLEASE